MRYLMAVLFVLAAAGTPEQCSQGEPDASVIIYPLPDASVILPPGWCEWDGGWRSDCRDRPPDPRYRDGGFPGSGIGSDPGTGILIAIVGDGLLFWTLY